VIEKGSESQVWRDDEMVDSPVKMRISLVLVLIGALVFSATPVIAAKLQVPVGTKIEIKSASNQEISSGKFNQGDKIPFVLAQPLLVGSQVVVPTGADVTAVVKSVEKSSRPGNPGKIELEFVSLTIPAGGTYKLTDVDAVPISGGTGVIKGNGHKLLSYLLGFGLIIKGGDAKLPADGVYPAEIAETVYLTSD
jgi:hypothetical protein